MVDQLGAPSGRRVGLVDQHRVPLGWSEGRQERARDEEWNVDSQPTESATG